MSLTWGICILAFLLACSMRKTLELEQEISTLKYKVRVLEIEKSLYDSYGISCAGKWCRR